MKIVILDGFALNPGDLDWNEFRQLGECILYDRTAKEDILKRAEGAEILILNKTPLNKTTIEQLPELKYIGVLATGYNIVDTEAAKNRGIIVTNIPSYSTPSVAQMVFAHLLNITTHVAYHSEQVKQGRWSRSLDFCFWDKSSIELQGLTMGIVGLGDIGIAVARLALAFEMKVMAYTSKPQTDLLPGIQKAEMESLFRNSDVISLHCPLTPETRGLVNEEKLSWMKSTAIMINTARGPIIDENTLARFLNEGMILAAGLDVLSSEPPLPDNPLLTAKNCYITPHFAWATQAARKRLMKIATNNLAAFLEGHAINNVASSSV